MFSCTIVTRTQVNSAPSPKIVIHLLWGRFRISRQCLISQLNVLVKQMALFKNKSLNCYFKMVTISQYLLQGYLRDSEASQTGLRPPLWLEVYELGFPRAPRAGLTGPPRSHLRVLAFIPHFPDHNSHTIGAGL